MVDQKINKSLLIISKLFELTLKEFDSVEQKLRENQPIDNLKLLRIKKEKIIRKLEQKTNYMITGLEGYKEKSELILNYNHEKKLELMAQKFFSNKNTDSKNLCKIKIKQYCQSLLWQNLRFALDSITNSMQEVDNLSLAKE